MPTTINDLRQDWQRQLKIYDQAIGGLEQGGVRQHTVLGTTHRELLEKRREAIRRRLAEHPEIP